MQTDPNEQHQILGIDFPECGARLETETICTSTTRFAVRAPHIGLYCGNVSKPHRHDWLPQLPWANAADFVEPGPFAGWLPADTFPGKRRPAKRPRRGGWDLSAARRWQFFSEIKRPDATCVRCGVRPFRGVPNGVEALRWLRPAGRGGLFGEVVDAINKMMPKPAPGASDWYDRLPADLRYAVRCRMQDAELEPEHAFSIAFLRAAKQREGARFTTAVQNFAVNSLALPLCRMCRRERRARLFESRDELFGRWAEYRFDGNAAAAASHPEYEHVVYLARLAYETDLVERVEDAARQRKRRA